MTKIIGIILAVCICLLGVFCCYLNYLERKAKKSEHIKEQERKKKNEDKESMESGNNLVDFNTSIELLHKYSKK